MRGEGSGGGSAAVQKLPLARSIGADDRAEAEGEALEDEEGYEEGGATLSGLRAVSYDDAEEDGGDRGLEDQELEAVDLEVIQSECR